MSKSFGPIFDAIIAAADESQITQTSYGTQIDLNIRGNEILIREFFNTGNFKLWWNGEDEEEGDSHDVELRLFEIVTLLRERDESDD